MLFLLVIISFLNPIHQSEADKISIEWLTPETHDFGDLIKGKRVYHTFKFKNTGETPIVISNVRPSCGCTAPDWDTSPVLPDSTSSINIEFDARDEGYFNKMIKVFFHGQRKGFKIYVEGYVEE